MSRTAVLLAFLVIPKRSSLGTTFARDLEAKQETEKSLTINVVFYAE